MIRALRLPIWKRAIIVLQVVTMPLWYVALVLWIGIEESAPDIIPFFRRAWELITAPLPAENDPA